MENSLIYIKERSNEEENKINKPESYFHKYFIFAPKINYIKIPTCTLRVLIVEKQVE